MITPRSNTFVRRHAWTLLAVALAGLDLSRHLFVGWVPHDEGTLALSGTLVRQGLWPHRDFVDVYSGGIALLSAGAQSLFGDDLRALRYPLFAAALGWVALLTATLRRFVPPVAAAALALLAFLWGPPLYPAPLPSWYLLFTATLVLWCLLRWIESGERRWLVAAGAGIGVALLLKINGLFLLAGAGSFLLADRGTADAEGPSSERTGTLLRTLALGLGVCGISYVVLEGWLPGFAYPLLLPIAALAVAGAARRWSDGESFRGLLSHLLPPVLALAAGIAVVTAPFLLLYFGTGAGAQLIEGILVLPFRRAESARMVPPLVRWPELLIGATLLLSAHPRIPARVGKGLALLVLGAGVWMAWRGHQNDATAIVTLWKVARLLLAGGLIVAAWGVLRRELPSRPLLAVGFITAWFACIQYPFAPPVYFAYVAPLAVILLAALVATLKLPPFVPSAVAVVAAVVTLGVNHGQGINTLGYRYLPETTVPLDLPRGGLEVPLHEAVAYEDIAALLDHWGARRIVAAPDSPEVYYLTGRPMVGREFYEFTAPRWDAEVLVQRIVEARAEAVVLKPYASFSPVAVDSVVIALAGRIRADTLIDRFRIIRLEPADASP